MASTKKNKLLFIFLVLSVIHFACTISFSPSGSLPTARPTDSTGTTRSKPSPVGSTIVDENGVSIVVNHVIRPGDALIVPSVVSSKKQSDEEHILVNLSITCTKPKDDQCFVSDFDYKVVGSKDMSDRISDTWAELSVNKLETTSFYGGNTITGYVPFIVKKDDSEIIFIYSGDSKHYLLLPPGEANLGQ